MQPDPACKFCQIAARDLASYVVFEDGVSFAFLDNRPLFPGHTLLVPKQHYETLDDLPADLIAPFFTNVQLLARAVERGMRSRRLVRRHQQSREPERPASACAHRAAPEKGRTARLLLAAAEPSG